MPLSRDFSLHDPFDLLDTVVVLQNIVATPAATVITRCLYVKPFVVVLEVRRFRRHRRSFRLRFLRRPPL